MKKIIFLVLSSILIIAVIVLCLSSKNEKNIQINNSLESGEIINELVSPSSTIVAIEKITGYRLNVHEILIGKDAFIRMSLDEKLIQKYALQEYQKKQNEYAENIEKKYISNLKYQIKNKQQKDNETTYEIEVEGYYYALYITDMTELAIEIYQKEGYELENVDKKEIETVAFYKAKVKAMELMNNYLNNYKNENEKRRFKITYINGKPKTRDDLITLTLNFKGVTYENMNFSNETNVQLQKSRIEKYINSGLSNGIFKNNDFLSLNNI